MWLFRVRSSTMAIVVLCLIAIGCFTAWFVAGGDKKTIANTLSFLGALLTLVGLAYAYIRSDAQLRARAQHLWALVTGRPIPPQRAYAEGIVSVEGFGVAWEVFSFNETEDRTEQLLRFVNALSERSGQVHSRINDLGVDLKRARDEARDGDRKTRDAAEAALRDFGKNLKQSQVLDLRWAIAGVFFSMLGAWLTFYT